MNLHMTRFKPVKSPALLAINHHVYTRTGNIHKVNFTKNATKVHT
jgi:hypothetical protein